MSDHLEHSDGKNNQPLFQNVDHLEQVYTPQQVSGSGDVPADENPGDTADASVRGLNDGGTLLSPNVGPQPSLASGSIPPLAAPQLMPHEGDDAPPNRE